MTITLTQISSNSVQLSNFPDPPLNPQSKLIVTDAALNSTEFIFTNPTYKWVHAMGDTYWTVIEGFFGGSDYSNADNSSIEGNSGDNLQTVDLVVSGSGWEITNPPFQPTKIKLTWTKDYYTLYGPTNIRVTYSDNSFEDFTPTVITSPATEEFTLTFPSPVATILGVTVFGTQSPSYSTDDDWFVDDISFRIFSDWVEPI